MRRGVSASRWYSRTWSTGSKSTAPAAPIVGGSGAGPGTVRSAIPSGPGSAKATSTRPMSDPPRSAAARRPRQRSGLPAGSGEVLRELGADRIFLDGLVSVWQPDLGRYTGK